ncbi:MAG: phenylalanine--tRNA ligase subunit beta, partial [Magnetococcales bacterium]|nr:phenylalanine--tRNA ligase subunit beta [Magnetococcales bacterium]
AQQMNQLLLGLGCQINPVDENSFQVIPPSWRHDLRREEDIQEEIIRLYGYDRVPTTLPRVPAESPTPNPMHHLFNRIRTTLVGCGYLEAINYAFVNPVVQNRFNPTQKPMALLNPLSADQSVLRTDLVAGLVETAQRNLNRGNTRLRLFEMGRVFLTDGHAGLTEQERLAGLLSGSAEEQSVHTAPRSMDFFDLKGDIEYLLADLIGGELVFKAGGPLFLHPERKATVFYGDAVEIGWMGQLHPSQQEAMDLRKEIFLFEFNLAPVLTIKKIKDAEGRVSRFPGIQSDFTFLLPERTPAQDVMLEAKNAAPELIQKVAVSAIYTGSGVPEGKKSLTLSLLLQAEDRTLTDTESKEIAERLITRMMARFGAVLR